MRYKFQLNHYIIGKVESRVEQSGHCNNSRTLTISDLNITGKVSAWR